MLRNGFLLIRCVFFALLVLLSLLTLAFASWSVNSFLKANQSGNATSGLIIFESCTFLVCVAISFIEVLQPKVTSTRIGIECGWVALMALFQLGEAISATINGSVLACRSGSTLDICASASLLVPSMWLKSILSFGYFFVLFITVLAHREMYDNIWTETIYTVAWLESGIDRAIARIDQDLEKAKRSAKDWDAESGSGEADANANANAEEDPYGGYVDDVESLSARRRRLGVAAEHRDEPAPWAKHASIRRGVDKPFSRTSTPAATPAPGANKRLPPAPLQPVASPKSNTSSRFIEKFRESRIISRFEMPSLYGSHFMNNGSGLPPTSPNRDLDKPIPLPPPSQWVRADDIRR